jgi:hypothetical protein
LRSGDWGGAGGRCAGAVWAVAVRWAAGAAGQLRRVVGRVGQPARPRLPRSPRAGPRLVARTTTRMTRRPAKGGGGLLARDTAAGASPAPCPAGDGPRPRSLRPESARVRARLRRGDKRSRPGTHGEAARCAGGPESHRSYRLGPACATARAARRTTGRAARRGAAWWHARPRVSIHYLGTSGGRDWSR